MVLWSVMRTLDLDRERSEKKLSASEFVSAYNEGLPPQFPRASLPFLLAFRKAYPTLFKDAGVWSLDLHRKRFMDWLPAHLKSLEA